MGRVSLPFRPPGRNNASIISDLSVLKQGASWTPGEVLQVTCTEHVDSVLQKEKERLVVIQCTFSWCRPCKGFKPKYTRMAAEYPQLPFLSLVANEDEQSKEVYERLETFTSGGMFGTPAHVLIRHGKLVAVCCTTTESKLKHILDEHLEPPTTSRQTIDARAPATHRFDN